MRRQFMRIWGWPLVIAVVSLVGLIAGLVGDDGWDWFAAACLGLPVLLTVWLGLVRRH
nr:hypothetical protein [uncultured Noviherbaspirillum sp.]